MVGKACRKTRFPLLPLERPLIIITTSCAKPPQSGDGSLRLNALVSQFRDYVCVGRSGGLDAGRLGATATDPPGCDTGEKLADAQVERSGAGRSECGW